MTLSRFRFPKSSRLHLRKEISELFDSGKTIHAAPLKGIYKLLPSSGVSLKVAVSVPKRYMPRAVDRNRVKRQMREAFRINCAQTRMHFENSGVSAHMMLVYNSKELPDYATITSKIILILQRLRQLHEKAGD